MKCKKCGYEVSIGEVFCQKCGTAIQIVPEYSPLEDEIETSLEEKTVEITPEQREKQRKRRERLQRKRRMQRIMIVAVIAIIVVLTAVSVILYTNYKKVNSFEYQYQMGLEYYQNGEYGLAVKAFAEAVSKDRENIEVRLSAAEAYTALGNYNRAVELLLEVVNLEPQVSYYEQLMKACELAGNTDLMNRILKETQGTPIGDALSVYRVDGLTVNLPGGTYHDYLEIMLISSQQGVTIYYTLDGTTPSENSIAYTEPIQIEKIGKTTLRAIAVNEAQLAGEELVEVYEISLLIPDASKISPESGKYEYGKKIEMEVPEGASAYYTTDGTIPTAETGNLYLEPVTMPLGNTIFAAIVVDKYGVSSEVVKKNYECTISRPFSYDAAVIKLKNYLVSIDMMLDLVGNRANGEKINVQFVSLTTVSDRECYIFNLRRTANNETTTLTDKIYAVTTQTGEVYTLTQDASGVYAFVNTTE